MPRGRIRRRWATGAAGCALMAGFLAGCTTARSNLGTSDSSCYLALPTATKAVNGHGHLFGVRRYTLSALRKQAPHLVQDLDTKKPGSQSVCVIGFTGDLAVAVSTTPGNHLLGTVIFTRTPLHFGHSHLF
jgi:hypothetical protein